VKRTLIGFTAFMERTRDVSNFENDFCILKVISKVKHKHNYCVLQNYIVKQFFLVCFATANQTLFPQLFFERRQTIVVTTREGRSWEFKVRLLAPFFSVLFHGFNMIPRRHALSPKQRRSKITERKR